jgi:cytochrome c peroxidase
VRLAWHSSGTYDKMTRTGGRHAPLPSLCSLLPTPNKQTPPLTHPPRHARFLPPSLLPSGGGTIRFREELAHGANAGLDKAVAWLEPVHAKHPTLSYADLYTLSGAVAVEAMGGPAITWRAGRVDAMDPAAVTPDGRLPEADNGRPEATAAALRKTFGRMGAWRAPCRKRLPRPCSRACAAA